MLAHASQLLRPRQAGTEVTPTSASSPRRHLLAARAPGHLGDLHVAAPTPWTPHSPPCSLPRRSPSYPNGFVAAVRHHRGHRLPLASLTGPEAPPRPPLSSTPSHATAGAPHRRHESSSPSTAAGLHRRIRRRQAVSEQAEPLFVIAVSSATVSPSPRARPRPLTTMAIGAEARRRHRTSPSWPQPRWVATEHAIVFNALAGARSTPARPSPCLLATSSTSPELRPPRTCSPPSFPATPAPPTATTRRGSLPASRRWSPPSFWSPECKTRAAPPRLASPAAKRRRV